MLRIKSSDKNFVILGLPRSGTTQLLSLCSFHPDLTCIHEPFLHQKRYKEMKSESELKKGLSILFNKYNGFKELINLSERNYWIRNSIYDSSAKIIFIERNNLLRQVISYIIAGKSHVWQSNQFAKNPDKKKKYLEEISKIGSISIPKIQRLIEISSKTNQVVKKELLNKDVFYIGYEDFYFSSFDYKKKLIKRMFDYIGVKSIFTSNMKEHLDNGRLNNRNVYSKISNVKEIDIMFSKHGQLINKIFL